MPPVRADISHTLTGHDVIVVLGAPVFTYHVYTDGPVIPAGAQLFQLTDDPETTTWAPVGTSILTTLPLGLTALLPLLEATERPWPQPRPGLSIPQPTDPIKAAFVMHTLAHTMPRDAIIVEEAPSHRTVLHDYLPIRTSGGFYAGASGGLGYALPAAVGVALGSPSRKVICLVGDGSCMYSIQALWSAAQQRLPITFVVVNNGEYAALKSFCQIMGIEFAPGLDLPGIDLVALAQGYGCAAVRIEKAQDLAQALSSALAAERPTLLDVIVDPSVPVLYSV